MTAKQVFLVVLGSGAFVVFAFVLVDSIRWRLRRRKHIRALRAIGLRVE